MECVRPVYRALRNHQVFRTVIPSNLFEGMGMGVPVLMSLPDGEACDIVRATGCGVTIAPENPEAMAMAMAIRRLASDPAEMTRLRSNASSSAPAYSRDQQAERMMDVMSALVSIAITRL